MPTIYQARCDRCGYASEVFSAAYGAVFVDEPQAAGPGSVLAGALFADTVGEGAMAEQPDPRFVVLAHPLEDGILKKTGYTWSGLCRAGRYFRVDRLVCRDCGTLFDTRRLTSPPALGCEPGCISALLAGAAVGIGKRNFWLGFATSCGLLFGYVFLVGPASRLYTRLRFRALARALEGPRSCPRCGSVRYARAESRRVFPCPKCAQESMRIHSVGIA